MNARALAALCCLAWAGCAEAEELTATNFGRRDAAGATVGTTTGQGVGSTSSTVASSSVATGSSTDSTASTGGAAGSAGAGTSGVGGSGGTGPTTVGAGGSSGAGGSAGAAGSGTGGAPTDAAVDRVTPPTMGLSLLYKNDHATVMADSIQCETTIAYTGTGLPNIPLSELTIRYYFTDDVRNGGPQVEVNYGNVPGPPYRDLAGAVTTGIAMYPPVTGADTYVEIGFKGSAGSIAPGDKAVVDWKYRGAMYPMVKQDNDYSCDITKTNSTAWDHIVIARNGNVVWGTPP